MSPHLSVSEAMDVAANLKLGEKMSKKEKASVTTVSTIGFMLCQSF